MTAPPGYINFLDESSAAGDLSDALKESINVPTLHLKARQWGVHDDTVSGTPLHQYETWQIWRQADGSLVFLDTSLHPAVKVIIDNGFTSGEIIYDYSAAKESGFYPTQNLELQLFSNWLGRQGNVILHASSVLHNGKSYCFVGHSGDGKSTLVRNIASRYPVVVLGEDHVILSRKETGFWVFGTPWHEDPEMCSPLGAPIDKLFFLDRSQAHGVKQLGALEGVTRLLQTARIPYYQPDLVGRILDQFKLLAEKVTFHTLSYPLGKDPWLSILAV